MGQTGDQLKRLFPSSYLLFLYIHLRMVVGWPVSFSDTLSLST